MSPVELFGEFDFANEYVGDFQGVDDGASPTLTGTLKDLLKKIPSYGEKAVSYVNKFENVYNQAA